MREVKDGGARSRGAAARRKPRGTEPAAPSPAPARRAARACARWKAFSSSSSAHSAPITPMSALSSPPVRPLTRFGARGGGGVAQHGRQCAPFPTRFANSAASAPKTQVGPLLHFGNSESGFRSRREATVRARVGARAPRGPYRDRDDLSMTNRTVDSSAESVTTETWGSLGHPST